MATVTTFEQNLFRSVEQLSEQPVREWDPDTLQLCLDLARSLRDHARRSRRALEERLSQGIDGRLAESLGQGNLKRLGDALGMAKEILRRVASEADEPAKEISHLFRHIEADLQCTYGLLSEVSSLSKKPFSPINLDRVRASEDAYIRGETKPFNRL